MPVITAKRYSREQIMADPESLYVFGDNLQRVGLAGQAAAARYCPNAVGIATLIRPGQPPRAEHERDLLYTEAQEKFQLLFTFLQAGGTVVWPEDGIGTGIANLQVRCPELLEYINERLEWLTSTFNEEKENDSN